jgi:hypothetical protein
MSTRRLNVDLHVCIEKCDAAASNQSKQHHSNSHLLRNDETNEYDTIRREEKQKGAHHKLLYHTIYLSCETTAKSK